MTGAAPARPVVALMIGELPNMPALNGISTAIVHRAVDRWRETRAGVLICESQPMTDVARAAGVPPEAIRTAIPETSGHTTRWAAERILTMPEAGPGVELLLVTHVLHARRAALMFRSLGMRARAEGLDIPFDPADPDWKLRSNLAFRAYNLIAYAYCFARGWLSA